MIIAKKVVKEAKKAKRRLHKARIPVRRAITPKKRLAVVITRPSLCVRILSP